jgi:hypothetical protein
MTKGEHFHLVNISEAQKMTVRELIQRIADHEKACKLKADALKRKTERTRQVINPPKKRKALGVLLSSSRKRQSV